MSRARWRKSSYSGSEGGDCVEVADLHPNALWRKSSHSGSSGGECVEVADLRPTVAVRDSKDPDRGVLLFQTDAFRAFVKDVIGR
ncbi:DUF397 domain-containing protein [Streptomyces sp. H27-D2]|uniref:DUF397 domain-containing protein n=1 Tax=Streptomyces sp. H27-D2 TaxID=3046304 RepID=UPI002DBF378A|nr:DUF397 domain-containing protein [Streptomyces sp. H27-D2]MEC4017224.1 DUF397 domain-containing protein [Streptomyces sp. H27-D2]